MARTAHTNAYMARAWKNNDAAAERPLVETACPRATARRKKTTDAPFPLKRRSFPENTNQETAMPDIVSARESSSGVSQRCGKAYPERRRYWAILTTITIVKNAKA